MPLSPRLYKAQGKPALATTHPESQRLLGAEWIRTFSSALDRRGFRGFPRVRVDHRPTGHPSSCEWAAADHLLEIIDSARRAIAGTQPPSDLELARTFGGGNNEKVLHRLIRLYCGGACCGRRLTVRQ